MAQGEGVRDRAAAAAAPAGHRPVRSFTLRQGRISRAQAQHYQLDLPRFGIAYRAEPLDLAACFGRQAPCVLEIGFGMGEALAQSAAAQPGTDFLGVEVHTPGVGSLLKAITAAELGNVRVIQHDAVEVVRDMLPVASLSGVRIFFPDPWPKKRHHKRRLIQAEFVHLLATRLAPGGTLHCATDWADYAQQMLTVLSAEPGLRNCARDFAPRPDERPRTRFESRGERLGHGVWDLLFRRA